MQLQSDFTANAGPGIRVIYATQWTGGCPPELWYRYMTESDNCHYMTRGFRIFDCCNTSGGGQPYENPKKDHDIP
jgi:hypothetical protein